MRTLKCFVGAALLFVLAAYSYGGVYYVSKTGSDVTGDGSEGSPFATIQKAITSAAVGDTVEVAEGTYNETIDYLGKSLTVQSADPSDGDVVAATIIDGGASGSVVTIGTMQAYPAWPTLTGFTIQNGSAVQGGGIMVSNCAAEITNCMIKDNTATGEGYRGGGGICAGNAMLILVANCTFEGNTASMGGGIGCFGQTQVRGMSNCVFTGNSAQGGGGAICLLSSGAWVENCTITGNTTVEWDGGGILVQWDSFAYIADSVISDNEANGGGGVAFHEQAPGRGRKIGPLGWVEACVISGNRARLGGGGGVLAIDFKQLFVDHSVIAGNIGKTGGGGVLAEGPGTIAVYNCTIDQNRCVDGAGSGGGVAAGWGAIGEVDSCVVRGNTASNGDQLATYGDGTQFFVSYSDVEGAKAAVYADGAAEFKWLGGNIDEDPLFAGAGEWDDNGTPGDLSDDTWTDGDYHVQSATGRWDPTAGGGAGAWVTDATYSPCIDAGDPAAWGGYYREPEPNGQRINMGAYGGTEYASKSPDYGPGDLIQLSVTNSHAKDADEAVWPDATYPPTFFWMSNVNTPELVRYALDVSSEEAIPADAKKTLSIGGKRTEHAPYSPTKGEWKKIRILAVAGGGTLYWRVRATDVVGTVRATSDVKKLVVDGGEWAVDALDLSAESPAVSWTHEAEGFVTYRVQFCVDDQFAPGAKNTLTVPAGKLTGSPYNLSPAVVAKLVHFAQRNSVDELYYRVSGADADKAFTSWSESATVALP